MTKEKLKSAFLKCLPMLIVLVSTGIFIFAIKLVVGIFYAPKDTVYRTDHNGEKFTVIQCTQSSSNSFYLLPAEFEFDEARYKKVGSDHDKIHYSDAPLAMFTLNEPSPDIDTITVKTLISGTGLRAYQFGEFVIFNLEGAYGVFAPLRNYSEASTNRKNDLYVIRQLLKKERWKEFELPGWESEEDFLEALEQIEWYLDAEYED